MHEEKTANKVRINKHPKRKNNDLVAAMHAMYETGRSLEEIGKTYRRSRQAVYDLFRSRKYPMRSKKLQGLTEYNGIRFTLNKRYLRGSRPDGTRVFMHYVVWENTHGKVPEDFCIHHKDNDGLNNAIENLELVSRKEMGIKFGKGRNQFSPGGSGLKRGERRKIENKKKWQMLSEI